jgi:hypothetical protein
MVEHVDHLVRTVYERMEALFPDGRTAYVFTSDHGMSEKVFSLPREHTHTHTQCTHTNTHTHTHTHTPTDDPLMVAMAGVARCRGCE